MQTFDEFAAAPERQIMTLVGKNQSKVGLFLLDGQVLRLQHSVRAIPDIEIARLFCGQDNALKALRAFSGTRRRERFCAFKKITKEES